MTYMTKSRGVWDGKTKKAVEGEDPTSSKGKGHHAEGQWRCGGSTLTQNRRGVTARGEDR